MAGDTAIIGRSSDCDVIIDRPDVSRRHVVLRRGLVVEDLGSRNGTHVDGARLAKPSALASARFEIGDATSKNLIVIEVLGEPEPSRPAPVAGMASSLDLAVPRPNLGAAVSPGPHEGAGHEGAAVSRLRAELAAETERYRAHAARLESELAELRRKMSAIEGAPPGIPGASGAAGHADAGGAGRTEVP